MRAWLLKFLVCTSCRSALTCEPPIADDGDVESATLVCGVCGANYPVVRGVPRMLAGPLGHEAQLTADAFGWQWQQFRRLHRDWRTYEERLLDWVAPLEPAFFTEKVVLDAGCGMGEFSAVAARFGAKRVVAVDIGSSVDAACRFLREFANVSVVQADIYDLPFVTPFDFVFSIGVIHHLQDPSRGVRALTRHVAPGGHLFVWVYGHENNGWVRRIVNPMRLLLTSRLPRPLLYVLTLPLAVALQVALKLAYSAQPDTQFARILPYYWYLHWLSQFGYRHNHCVVFDHLNAPIAHYVRQEELRSWLEHAGLSDIALSWRNRNSWRGFARRPVQ